MKCTTIPTKEIKKALTSSGPLIREISNPLDKMVQIQQAIERNVEIHFGIRTGLLSDDLVKAVIEEVAKKFGSLSIKDIDHAFDLYTVTKDSWKNVTKRDIIQPLSTWWQRKESVKYEFTKAKIEEEEKIKGAEKLREFKNKSIELYNQALNSGVWEGDLFNASAIAKEYLAEHIDQSVKNELWIQAQRKYKEAKNQTEESKEKIDLSPEHLGASEIRIFSELIILKALEYKIQIIE